MRRAPVPRSICVSHHYQHRHQFCMPIRLPKDGNRTRAIDQCRCANRVAGPRARIRGSSGSGSHIRGRDSQRAMGCWCKEMRCRQPTVSRILFGKRFDLHVVGEKTHVLQAKNVRVPGRPWRCLGRDQGRSDHHHLEPILLNPHIQLQRPIWSPFPF